MADRLFDRDLYVFAADFYAQAMAADVEKQFVPSNRFRYRYLVTLLAFVGPQGPNAHMIFCRSVAWSMAQWFRRRDGSASHVLACFEDSHFYRVRDVYSTSFPAMYRVIFAWMDGPAGRIARWWRRQWTKLHVHPHQTHCNATSREKQEVNEKPTRNLASSTRHPQGQTRTGLRGKVLSPSPSPTRKPRPSDQIHKSKEPGKRTEKNSNASKKLGGKQQPPGLSNNAPSFDESQQIQGEQNVSTIEKRRNSVKARAATKKPNEFCEHSPTKRRLNVVK